jgi:CelD/BcsL family acetyltransferase involved in cellulose biosynthesis
VKTESADRLDAVDAVTWDAVVAASRLRSPFLSATWQRQWAAVFAEGRRLDVRLVCAADGSLVAALPLYEAAPGVLELIGGADVSDYLDLLAAAGREDEAWSALLAARAADTASWVLHAVPAASPTVTALPGLASAVGLHVDVTLEERCPVLELPASWDAYLATLSSKHRHELTRKIRRFEREAPDGRVVLVRGPQAIADRLDDFLALHRRSRVGKAKFMDERMERFFRRAITALAARGRARLALLDTASGPIAAFVTLEWDGTVGLYNSGFAPAHAALSPGLVLLAGVVRDAIDRGRRTFDFLRGEERYKYEFGPTPEPVHCVTIGRGTLAGFPSSPPLGRGTLAGFPSSPPEQRYSAGARDAVVEGRV